MARDAARIAGALSRASASVAADALAEPRGAALPLSPEPWTQPSRLAQLIRDAGVDARFAPEAPRHARLTTQHLPSSNCLNSIVALEWDGPKESDEATRPRSVFVKQSSPDLATRLFAHVVGFWQIECMVARRLAAQVPIETPRIFAVAERRSRFVIVMENLLERADTGLFVNRDMLSGLDVEGARRCVRALARLHAGFEGWGPARREAALPIALHPFLSPSREPVLLALNRLAVPRCARRSKGVLGTREAALALRAFAHWPELQAAWYPEPLTLVHGDSHLGNFFETRGELGLLDFQGAHWGKGTRDVAYLLINSMPADRLAQHEKSLVETYVEARARLGAPLDAERAWDEYRGFSFQTLMTATVSSGLGSFTDSDDVIQTMLERSVEAVVRLRFGEWLDGVIDRARAAGRGPS